MLPFALMLPVLVAPAPQAGPELPILDSKDLPAASRGPNPPEWPDPGRARGIMGETRAAARRGPSIPALQVPAGSVRIRDKVPAPSGWRALAVDVAPHGQVSVEVVEGRRAWFKVKGVNAWGRLEEGLLQNAIFKGVPKATYTNPTGEAKTIYFIVDTTDYSMAGEAYEVEVRRDVPSGAGSAK